MTRLLLAATLALALVSVTASTEAKQRSQSAGIVKTNIKPAGKARTAKAGRPASARRKGSGYSARRARLLPVVRSATPKGLPAGLVDAVIAKESRYDVNARGSRGEIGLMQILPSTARRIAKKIGEPAVARMSNDTLRKHLTDPRTNIRFGTNFLRTCHKMAKGDIAATVGCYNAGPANMWRWSKIKITRAYVSFVRNHMANDG